MPDTAPTLVLTPGLAQLPLGEPKFTFFDGKSPPFAFQISFENGKGSVTLGDAVTWDDAGKTFWNVVHAQMGHPVPFPEHPSAAPQVLTNTEENKD